MPDLLDAGAIINTHGVRGDVKVDPWADSPDFLTQFRTLYIDGQPRRVVSARVHTRFVLIHFEGVDTVEDAMKLRGRTVYFDRADAKLPEGTYFLADIIGFDVFDLRKNAVIGRLAELLPLPAGDVYRVESAGGDILIPARPEFTRGIDPASRTVTVETIPGMGDGQ
ncbi:MAG: ribosome maturation factor RimM [Eubacteriales bacterium]|nr:ribosome maturation factor RimM [Eubacteriales bacterium]MDY5016320.1 ribosome maturation factor RimM [Eubacteriales bacterium]